MARDGDGRMGLWMTGALVVGTMIGAGIFMLPVSLAPLGRNAVAAWFVSSAGALCIAATLARLSRLGGDGIQANVERELGALPGFLTAWAFWVSNWVAQAATAIAGASALSWLDPALSGPGFVIPVAVAAVASLTAVNAAGARASGGMSILTVAVKLLPLLAVVLILGLRAAGPASYEPLAPAPFSVQNLAAGVALTFFALTGFENATTPVDKVRDPARTIPRAILGGTLLVALLYLLSSTAVQLLLPAKTAAASAAPFADVIAGRWGPRVAALAALAIAVAAFGCLNGLILATGELGYAMGLRRDLPAVLAWTRGAGTPVGAQLAGAALSILLILANSSRATNSLFSFIILLSTAAVLVVYTAGALAAWRLDGSARGRAIVVVALLFILFAAYGSGAEANGWCVALLAAGLAVRFLVRLAPTAGPSRAASIRPARR